jgi:hypothetical protein
MVKKFNLSEAAADILNKSIATGRSRGDMSSQRLTTSIVPGQKEVGDIGTEVTKTTDSAPQATKGAPTATPPGATPPVGAEPMKKLQKQPAEDNAADQGDPEGKPGKQLMQKNPGATFQSYGGQKNEEVESDEEVFAEEKEEGHEDEKEDKKMIKGMVKKDALKEDIDALMQGENLSEEFVKKATTIFEAAVISRVEEIAEEVQSQLQEQFDAAVEELKEDYATKIDDYLNYMVEEWMKENQLAIDTGLRAEIVEDFIGGLRNLFAEHYIDIPEEKVDVVQEMADKVEELEDRLNEEIQRNIEFKKEINEAKKIQAVQTVCEGLTQTQAAKLKSLAESVEFTSEEEFAEKLSTLKEAYAPSSVKPAEKTALEEGVEIPEDKPRHVSADPLVDAVAKSISKSVVK